LPVSIPVSTRTDEWIAAEVLRDEFMHSQKDLDAVDPTTELENNWEATLDLFARFLGFIAGSLHGDQQSPRARTLLLASVFAYFMATYLTERDVHSVAATCDTDSDIRHRSVLSSYSLALAALEDAKVADISRGPAPKVTHRYSLFLVVKETTRCTSMSCSPSTISTSHTWLH
jgi:fatty acid synthase subunit beta